MEVLNIQDMLLTIYSVHEGFGCGQIACDPIIKLFIIRNVHRYLHINSDASCLL